MHYILLLLTPMVLFREIYMFLQPTCLGLTGENRAYLHLETLKLQKMLLEKLPQFSLSNNELGTPASSTDGIVLRHS
jgi:hypothetical protein